MSYFDSPAFARVKELEEKNATLTEEVALLRMRCDCYEKLKNKYWAYCVRIKAERDNIEFETKILRDERKARMGGEE